MLNFEETSVAIISQQHFVFLGSLNFQASANKTCLKSFYEQYDSLVPCVNSFKLLCTWLSLKIIFSASKCFFDEYGFMIAKMHAFMLVCNQMFWGCTGSIWWS